MTEKSNNTNPTVFISFQHKSSDFVDSLEQKLSQDANVIRYEDGIPSWGSFREFMNTIKDQDFAVLVISEEYLQSEACMYEVIQLMQNANWVDKAMFAIMPNAACFNYQDRINYIKYWNEQVKLMDESIGGLPEQSIANQKEELSRITQIRDSIGAFLDVVADRKNPKLHSVIDDICERIWRERKPILKLVEDGRSVALGEWYVREFLNKYGSMTANQIIEASGLSKSYVSKLLRNLIMHGNIKVIAPTHDKKSSKYFSCTDANNEVS